MLDDSLNKWLDIMTNYTIVSYPALINSDGILGRRKKKRKEGNNNKLGWRKKEKEVYSLMLLSILLVA